MGNRLHGEGVVVGIINTGMLSTHEVIKGNFRTTYNWFDPYESSTPPKDTNGHGTHVTATIVRANGIGVAPSAKWIACKGCDPLCCGESALIACGQFMTCPTSATGSETDCSKAPRVVSNSWGGGQGNTFFDSVISAWHAAGIIPVFAIGNEGSACETVRSPGDSKDVIAVGATASDDKLGSFSCKASALSGVVKPDISAPGGKV